MRNDQLKPAYNIQCSTNGSYLIGIENFSKPSDMATLISFLNKLNKRYVLK